MSLSNFFQYHFQDDANRRLRTSTSVDSQLTVASQSADALGKEQACISFYFLNIICLCVYLHLLLLLKYYLSVCLYLHLLLLLKYYLSLCVFGCLGVCMCLCVCVCGVYVCVCVSVSVCVCMCVYVGGC